MQKWGTHSTIVPRYTCTDILRGLCSRGKLALCLFSGKCLPPLFAQTCFSVCTQTCFPVCTDLLVCLHTDLLSRLHTDLLFHLQRPFPFAETCFSVCTQTCFSICTRSCFPICTDLLFRSISQTPPLLASPIPQTTYACLSPILTRRKGAAAA